MQKKLQIAFLPRGKIKEGVFLIDLFLSIYIQEQLSTTF